MKTIIITINIMMLSISCCFSHYLWSWGHNYQGQLGDGTYSTRNFPQQAGTVSNWKDISAGLSHTVAIRSDGTLWAWGRNYFGQLGDGSTTDSNVPIQIGTNSNWMMIASGDNFCLALKTDGTLWAWGYNAYGQLGDGSITDRYNPVQVGTSNNWLYISAGNNHCLGIRTNGTLWAWGNNYFGQLGDSTTTNRNSPVQIGTSNNWSVISAGYRFSLAIKTDGTLWSWGNNLYGQLGDGSNNNYRISPVQIGTSTNWSKISSFPGLSWHSLGLKTDGTLWAWGYNEHGQIGDGSYTERDSPVRIGTDNNWISIDAGAHFSTAIKSDSSLWFWGYNNWGQLGDSTNNNRNVPVQIGTNNKWIQVTAAQVHSVALGGIATAVYTSTLSTSICPGSTIRVPFSVTGTFNSGNTFTAQLSSSTGSFASPTTIGTKNGTSSDTITCFIPKNTPAGTGYRIRVIASNPSVTGSDNGANITINSLPTVSSGTGSPQCLNATAGYNLTGSYAGHTFKWLVTGGQVIGNDNQQSVNIKWTRTGSDTLYAIVTNPAGCSDTGRTYVNVNPLPSPAITGDSLFCTGASSGFTTTSTSGHSYKWYVTGGTIQGADNTTSLSVTWGTGTAGMVKLVETITATGCQDSVIKNITLNPRPTPTISGSTNVCEKNQTSFSTTNTAGHEYKWKVTGGTIQGSDATNQVNINWGNAATGSIRLIETITATGCRDSAIKNITINPLPTVNISGTNTVCEKTPSVYSIVNNPGYSYKWSASGGTLQGADNTNQVTINWGQSGSGNVKLIVSNNTTGCKDSTEQAITINPSPAVTITGSNTVCAQIQEQYSGPTGTGLTYQWIVAGGSINGSSNENNVTINWSSSGTGSIKLIVTNSNNCKDSAVQNVLIQQGPVVSINGSNLACPGDSTYYSTPQHTNCIFKWSAIGGSILGDNSQQGITVKWQNSPGTAQIKLVIENTSTGCKDSSTYTVQINDKPNPQAIGPLTVPKGTSQSYTSNSQAGITDEWSLISGGTIMGSSTSKNVIVNWGQPGTGQLKLIQTNQWGCRDSVVITITISNSSIALTGSNSVCEKETAIYSTPDNNLVNNNWSVTGGTISGVATGNTIQVGWGNSGTGTVKLVQTNKTTQYRDSAEISVTVNALPKPQISGETNVCSGCIITYTINQQSNVSYLWSAEGGTVEGSNIGSKADIKWGLTGSGRVKALATNMQTKCRDSSYTDVEISTAPGLQITGPDRACSGRNEEYKTASSLSEYNLNWVVTGGTISGGSTSANVTIIWQAEGTGKVKLLRTNKTSQYKDSVEKSVTVSPKPDATIDLIPDMCINDAGMALTGGKPEGGIYSIDAKSETSVDPARLGTGQHIVKYEYTNPEGCSDTAETAFNINPVPPQPTITEQGDSLISSSTSGNQWYYHDTLIVGATGQVYVTDKEGIYTVRITQGGCTSDGSEPHYYPSGSDSPIIVTGSSHQYANILCEPGHQDTITISNAGGSTLTITGAEISGTNADEFAIEPSFKILSIEPTKKENLAISFIPKSTGKKEAQLTLTSNAGNKAEFTVSLSAKKDSSGFELVPNTIEFKDLPINISVVKNIQLKNTGTVALSWTTPILIDNDFTIESINPPVIQPGSQSVMKVSFSGGPDSAKYGVKYKLIEGNCGNERELEITGNVGSSTPPASAVIRAGVAEARPGEIVGIPIYLDSAVNLNLTKTTGFNAELTFNKTLLVPVFETEKGETDQKERIVPLVLPVNSDNKGVLKTVYFQAVLGNDTTTQIGIKNPISIGDSVSLKSENGQFTLKGICMEDGYPRLINPDNVMVLESPKPNPVDKRIEFDYQIIEDGFIKLFITNSFGDEVAIIRESNIIAGKYSAEYDVSDLSSGIYFINLKTRTIFKSVKFEIQK